MEFIEYQKCSTCKKAKKFLEDNNIIFQSREIKERTPTYDELNNWIKKYNIDIKKLFNTSGLIYRNLQLKDKIDSMTEEEKLILLSNNAMLIKRPILVNDNNILVGFNKKQWEQTLKS